MFITFFSQSDAVQNPKFETETLHCSAEYNIHTTEDSKYSFDFL